MFAVCLWFPAEFPPFFPRNCPCKPTFSKWGSMNPNELNFFFEKRHGDRWFRKWNSNKIHITLFGGNWNHVVTTCQGKRHHPHPGIYPRALRTTHLPRCPKSSKSLGNWYWNPWCLGVPLLETSIWLNKKPAIHRKVIIVIHHIVTTIG